MVELLFTAPHTRVEVRTFQDPRPTPHQKSWKRKRTDIIVCMSAMTTCAMEISLKIISPKCVSSRHSFSVLRERGSGKWTTKKYQFRIFSAFCKWFTWINRCNDLRFTSHHCITVQFIRFAHSTFNKPLSFAFAMTCFFVPKCLIRDEFVTFWCCLVNVRVSLNFAFNSVNFK